MTARVAVFRPDDDRMATAVSLLESLCLEPVADPMLAVEPTGAKPRSDAGYVIFTSTTGAELVPSDWEANGATVCAIGPRTRDALEDVDISVDLVPETFSSRGMVETLENEIDGKRVEVARSDHGSDVLLDGLDESGAYHHETVLYRLVRPSGSGHSTEMAATGDLDAALFTSSLTVEHFLAAAADREVRETAVDGLDGAVVGAIGAPTAETAREYGIDVDVVPEEATFESLARAVASRLDPSTG